MRLRPAAHAANMLHCLGDSAPGLVAKFCGSLGNGHSHTLLVGKLRKAAAGLAGFGYRRF
jgi:hypothetical protein